MKYPFFCFFTPAHVCMYVCIDLLNSLYAHKYSGERIKTLEKYLINLQVF